jgi:Arc/MetJ family transcription regulator
MGTMTRTNIEIDDELVAIVMKRYGLKTKKDAVDLALRQVAGTPLTQEFLDSVHGMGWDGDLAEIRKSRNFEW